MRCTSCGEDVQEGAAIAIAPDTARRIVDPEIDDDEYEVQVITGLHFHLRYVPGVLPPRPDTSELHAGPVICGPLEES